MFISSCGTTEKVTKSRSSGKSRTIPKKKKRTPKPEKVDTVQWKEVDITVKEEKSASSSEYSPMGNTEKKDHYDIAMLIPLDARKYNNESRGNTRMMNYYAGAKMALDKLEQEGANITLHTTDVGEGSISSHLRSAKSNGADVIIGPYDKEDLKQAASYAKKEQITLVSPWISSSKTADDNPYYVQLKPSLLDHYQKMIEDVSKNYKLDQIVLLAQEGNRTDVNRAKYIQKLARSYFNSKDAKPITEYFILQDSLRESRMLFYEHLEPEETKVFLLPNMNSKDEQFIYGAIRRLTAERGECNVVLYGMPIVLDSEKFTFDNYNGTSAHVLTSNFIDSEQDDVRAFRRNFYDLYGAIPQDEAFEGYDMMLYVGRALMEHGIGFQYKMDKKSEDLLQANIAIYPMYKKADDRLNKRKDIDYFANKNIEVIYFKDNRFQKK